MPGPPPRKERGVGALRSRGLRADKADELPAAAEGGLLNWARVDTAVCLHWARLEAPTAGLQQSYSEIRETGMCVMSNTIHRLFPTRNRITLQHQYVAKIGLVGKGVDRRIILPWSTPNIDQKPLSM